MGSSLAKRIPAADGVARSSFPLCARFATADENAPTPALRQPVPSTRAVPAPLRHPSPTVSPFQEP